MNKLELDTVCSPCRERLKAFYEYFRFVLENQTKFKAFVAKEGFIPEPDDTSICLITKVDPTEFVTMIKDEPEEDCMDSDSDVEYPSRDDFSASPPPTKTTSDPNPCKEEAETDAAVKAEPAKKNKFEPDCVPSDKENVIKPKKKGTRKRLKLTTEERGVKAREKDELIKKFVVLKCELCPDMEPFSTYSALNSHSRRLHQQEAMIRCCGRLLKSKFLLASHLQMHLNKPTCEKCGETFTTNRKLESHRKIAHAICEICGVDLRRKKLKPVDVWSHMQQHALSADPMKPTPFICDLCNKPVKDRNRFKAHIKYRHYDRVACICEHCGTSFKFKHQYTEHNRVQHPNGWCLLLFFFF